MKLLVQCLEVPSYSSEKVYLTRSDYQSSTVFQAFLQLATRLNSVFINFCVYPWMLPVYRVPGDVVYVFFSAKIGIKVDNSFNV